MEPSDGACWLPGEGTGCRLPVGSSPRALSSPRASSIGVGDAAREASTGPLPISSAQAEGRGDDAGPRRRPAAGVSPSRGEPPAGGCSAALPHFERFRVLEEPDLLLFLCFFFSDLPEG
jgi:hypothetical protein